MCSRFSSVGMVVGCMVKWNFILVWCVLVGMLCSVFFLGRVMVNVCFISVVSMFMLLLRFLLV